MAFEIPENVAALSDEDLAAAIEAAYGEGADLSAIDDAEITDEQVSALSAIADFIRAAEGEEGNRTAAAAERAERIAAARAAVVRPTDEAQDDEESEEPEDEVVAEEPADEVVEVTEVVADPVPVAVAASATPAPAPRKKNAVARTAQAPSNEPAAISRSLPTITAAAGALELQPSSRVADLNALVPEFIRRFQSFSKPVGDGKGSLQRFPVAQVTVDNPLNDKDITESMALLRAAADESRLSGGSLTAAGGWCAPSETIYDLCGPLATNDGVVDIPEITLSRGGLRFTKGIDWAALFAGDLAGIGGTQTEAQAEAGTAKTCNTLECPDFEDHRMDAEYLCTTIPLLTEAGYPELVRDFIEGTLLAHRVKMSRKDLADMLTIAGAAVTIPDVWPNALSLLHALELVILGERQRHNMGESATLEVVVPSWVRGALRADLANRNGVELTNVSNAQIDAHFSVRGARVQFVKRWPGSDLVLTAGVATDYPTTTPALIYPAGTYVRGVQDVIRLDAVYDAASLQVNTYTGMFVEQGRVVMNRCYTPRLISLTAPVTGRTAAADISQVFGTAAA